MDGLDVFFQRSDNLTINVVKTFTVRGYSGIASINLLPYGKTIGNEIKFLSFYVTCQSAKLQIDLQYQNDQEISGGGTDYHHQLDELQDEINGDNLADYLESGSAQTKKNVKVVIDYPKDFGELSKLDDILDLVNSIWSPYGVELTLVKGKSIEDIPESASMADIKGLLSENKQWVYRDHIHVIIGKKVDWDNSLYGVNIHYGENGENLNYVECANLASGDTRWRDNNAGHDNYYYLNRTGIFITQANTVGACGDWDIEHIYAWNIAHELGHAMGIYCHTGGGVYVSLMTPNDFCTYSWSYSILIEQESLDKLNTRNRLGVETVDIGNSKIQE